MGAIILASIGINNYSSFKEAIFDLIKIEKKKINQRRNSKWKIKDIVS